MPNAAKPRTKEAIEARFAARKPSAEPPQERNEDPREAPRRRKPPQDRGGPSEPRHHDRQGDAYQGDDVPRRRPRPSADDRPREERRGEDSRYQRDRDTSPDTRPRRSSPRPDNYSRAPRASEVNHFFVPCPKGLEGELAAELGEIGVEEVRPAPGGVAFRGDLPLAWRVNLWSRLAVRVLWRVGEGPYREESDLYDGALKVDWPSLFDVSRTLAVNTLARHSPLQSLNFASLKIKDAVCDRFRATCGERPSVDTHTPDVPLVLYLTDARYSLYVDLSGEPLNRRGFRVEPAAAPLNENLAAGLIRLSGWRPGTPFFDPMMGGGTLLIEAAMMWLHRAPGLNRHFAFENLNSFDHIAWQRLRKDAEGAALEPESLPIFGSDIDPQMVRAAGLNLKAADLLDCVQLLEADFLEVDAPPVDPGVIVCNPPYGVRLSVEDVATFYHTMGDVLKQRYAGWSAYFISADEQFPKTIGLSASRRTPLFNGPLECRYYEYRLVAGSNRPLRSAPRS
jgi:putative N6-adenine-specific DNA methylase